MIKVQQKSKSFPVNNLLQRSFIIMFFLSIALGTIQIIYWIIKQYPTNYNLSSYLLISVQTLLLPLIMFGLAFVTGPRLQGRQGRLFEAVLLTSLGLMVSGLINQFSTQLFFSFFTASNYWNSIFYSLSLSVLAICVYSGGLYYYRRHQKS